jgi:hypothetical protein
MKPKLDGEHSEASQSVTERATPWVTPGEDYGSDVPISGESFEEAKRLLAAKDVDGLAAMIRVVPKRPSGPEGIPTEAKDAAAPIERRGGTGSAADGPSLKSNLDGERPDEKLADHRKAVDQPVGEGESAGVSYAETRRLAGGPAPLPAGGPGSDLAINRLNDPCPKCGAEGFNRIYQCGSLEVNGGFVQAAGCESGFAYCPACSGSGYHPDSFVMPEGPSGTCPHCKGEGRQERLPSTDEIVTGSPPYMHVQPRSGPYRPGIPRNVRGVGSPVRLHDPRGVGCAVV